MIRLDDEVTLVLLEERLEVRVVVVGAMGGSRRIFSSFRRVRRVILKKP